MTERTRAQLICMFSCVFGEQENKKVNVFFNRNKNLYYASAEVEGLGEVELWEQNKSKNSIFADAYRKGIRIAWVIDPYASGSGFTGWMVAELPGRGVNVYSSDELRLLLNPIIGLIVAGKL